MNNRQTIVHDKNHIFRIVSLPNGFWQYQKCVGGKGTSKRMGQDKKGKRIVSGEHFDPWQAMNRPTDFETAKMQLDTFTPNMAKKNENEGAQT